MSEVKSLLEDKEALREVSPEEFEKMKKEADQGGRKFEAIPSKLVFVKKPGGEGAPPKYKSRWVVCGNLEPVRDDELTFSSGADAAALRVTVWFSSCCHWSGSILDVHTAFLNAKMHQEDDKPILLVQPHGVFFKKKLMKPGTLFKPEKAIYGFRRSPRLWGPARADRPDKWHRPYSAKWWDWWWYQRVNACQRVSTRVRWWVWCLHHA